MKDVKIVAGLRTPFGKFGGSLKDFSTIDLSALTIRKLLEKANVPKEEIEEVNLGVCTQAEAEEVIAPIIARQALLKAGLSSETISMTIDKACCSGMVAIKNSFHSIQREEVNVSIAGGAEVMSRTPILIRPLRWGNRLGDVLLRDPAYGLRYVDYNLVSFDASEVALEFGVTREEQDEWALRSQLSWKAAYEQKKFDDEIISVNIKGKKGADLVFHTDEFPRPNTKIEKLAKLETVFNTPTITAGNSPGLNDGAATLLLMAQEKTEQLELSPLATIISTASVATEPRMITTVPAIAIEKALKNANLTIDDIKLFEINEAFAAVPLVSSIILGKGDMKKINDIRKKLNVNGGAIAIGHPVGASGARIVISLINELKRRGGGYGVASICGGLAQGEAIIVKV